MIQTSQYAIFLVVSVILWLASLASVPFFGREVLALLDMAAIMAAMAAAGAMTLVTLNRGQQRVVDAYKELSRVRRSLQESHLEIDRYEYESRQGAELRRLVLTSAQEKDQALDSMASALNTAMAEVLSLTRSDEPRSLERIRDRAELMQRYAEDLKALARLELKSELPRHQSLNFLAVVERFIDEWNRYGRSRDVRVRLEHQEDQLPLVSDENWLHNLLTRAIQALVRMNRDTTIDVHLIGYIDAKLGDALRVTLSARGRRLDPEQLASAMSAYTRILDQGNDVGPGLSFVVARRLAQMLQGYLEVNDTETGTEVVLVLPRRLDDPLEDDNG